MATHPAHASDRFLPVQIPHWASGADETDQTIYSYSAPQPAAPNMPHHTPLPMTPQDYQAILQQIIATKDTVRNDGDPKSARGDNTARIEEYYSGRAGEDLEQFGYDFFAKPSTPASSIIKTPDTALSSTTSQMVHEGESFRNIPSGAVQDHFVLGIGDRLNVILRGQRNHQKIYTITSDGLLVIEDLPPILAAGQTIGRIRSTLENAAKNFHNTDIFLSLESVRQVGVLVVGHVHQPGRQNLTVFHSALDALTHAGGVKKTGSLRQIKLIRDGRSHMIDLYGVLNQGDTGTDIALRDGDRLVVPAIGPTIAIAGDVKRPAIYEILPQLKTMRNGLTGDSQYLSLQQVLELGGGVLGPGANRFIKLEMANDGREMVTDLPDPLMPAFGDGSILMVSRATEKRSETVTLAGHTRQAGIHALSRADTLSALIPDTKIFGPDIYPLLGVVERLDKTTLSRQFLDFPPQLVVTGQYDRKLQDGDKILLFSREEILDLQKTGQPDKNRPDKNREDSRSSGLQGKTARNLRDNSHAAGNPHTRIRAGNDNDQHDLLSADPALRDFLREHAVSLRGAVRDNGLWPVAEGTTLNSLIAASGGFSLDANRSNIEITAKTSDGDTEFTRSTIDYDTIDPETIIIAAGSTIRINQKFRKAIGQTVTITGEVNHPGKYDLLPGDTLGKLIARAGMLTPEAYPAGTIFSRDSLRKAEEARFRAAAQELERAVATATETAKNPPDQAQMLLARDLAAELRNVTAIGRITVEANPAILKTHPELDILLEPDDRIYIPRRPLSVRVHGEVQSPASLQFRSTKDPANYISEAGGMTYYADRRRVFVLYPDGSAQPLQVNAWNHTPVMIPPGSTIVVPRDPKPFDFLDSARDFSQILANLSIAGIFLHDLHKD